ncbi:uncharacterized protein LOC120995157 isoform X2 [Bufo bufo]|uniref:uncharacterized protein LOC120995157 isoform X2 n=1 Tax=Bufo bufo TaxID=8384 RepID=UPI001ABEC702|nr:uncharacterized protein LOC120995157 isoform X2 [Bufo bufo]
MEDHNFIRTRKLYQITKKMDCPAKIYVYHLLTFPDFQINKNTEWLKRSASTKLKNYIQKEDAKGINIYMVLFPKLSDHTNHITSGEVAHLREKIDPRVRNKIQEFYRTGIRKKSELKRLVEHFVKKDLFLNVEVPEDTRRRYYPTIKDIANIISRSRHDGHSSLFDQGKLLQLIEEWQHENPSYSMFSRPHTVSEEPKAEQNFLFCYQSEWQKKILVQYGNEMTLLDATYRTTRYALPLYFLCVRTNVCYAVVGAFVLQQERTEDIVESLKIIAGWNTAWAPSCFMVDFCLEEINAIEQVFPDADIKLCDFHREKAWTEWLNKKDHGVRAHKKEILALLRNVALTTKMEDHELALKVLTSSNIWKQSKTLRAWLSHKWLPDIKKWAHVYRKSTQVIGVNTNNGLERQHETLKYSYLDGYRNCLLSDMISVLHHGFFPDTFKKYMEKNLRSCEHYRKYAVNVPNFLKNRPREMLSHVMQRYFSSLDETHILQRDEQHGIFKVQSESDSNLSYSLDLSGELPDCGCKDWQRYLLPCKHMCAVFRTTSFQWENLNPAYTGNPLFALDTECFKTVINQTPKKHNVGLTPGPYPELASDFSGEVLQGLPPRRRRKRTGVIRECRKSLKRLEDLTFVLDDQTLQDFSLHLKNLVVDLSEKTPKSHGLILLDSTLNMDTTGFKDLPERRYGKSKQPELKRFGKKADQIKEDLCQRIGLSDEPDRISSEEETSQSIWLTVNKFKLTLQDRDVISKGLWLDDQIINASQIILSQKHVDVSGFMDTVVLAHSEVALSKCHQVIQIHHVGMHWLLSHQFDDNVTIYDSLATTSFSDTLKEQLIKLYRPLFTGENKTLEINATCCQTQKGASDCGVFAIANGLALLEGVNLRNIQFIQDEMRPHLISCLERGEFSMFPYEEQTRRRIPTSKVVLTTYCICHIYKSREPMIECSGCKSWYHFCCLNLQKKCKYVSSKKRFFCSLCTK